MGLTNEVRGEESKQYKEGPRGGRFIEITCQRMCGNNIPRHGKERCKRAIREDAKEDKFSFKRRRNIKKWW